MSASPVSLDELIGYVKTMSPEGGPLDNLADAVSVGGDLDEASDALIGHFVDRARRSGATWSQIGASMGVTKQAAQKRFVTLWEGADFSRFTQRSRNVLAAAGGIAAGTGAGDEDITTVSGAAPGGRFVDFGAVHLVTTRALAELEADGGPADVRRLRPNLVLAVDREPVPGDRIRVGPEVTLRVLVPTPRCALPGAAQPGLPSSPGLLRAIGRRRVEIPGLGRAACFGSYAQVLAPGTVTVGDLAEVSS